MVESLVVGYCTHLESEGGSPKTIEWHRYSLRRFVCWLHDSAQPLDPNQWTPTTIRTYFLALRQTKTAVGAPLSAHSIRSYANSLRSFCRWLFLEEFTPRDVMERVKQPRAPRLVQPTFSADEVRRMLGAIKGVGRNARRDEALVLFMLDTGARASEVCTMSETDMSWSQRIAKVYGKGAKERYLPFSAATMRAMQRYAVKERRGEGAAFFQSEEGNALTPSGLLQLCKRLGHRTGVKAAPHKFRHTFAITYLRNGGSVFALQKTLGHTSLDMTLRYSALLTDDIAREHHEHSPVASLIGGSRRAN